jgi:hypothetical protein
MTRLRLAVATLTHAPARRRSKVERGVLNALAKAIAALPPNNLRPRRLRLPSSSGEADPPSARQWNHTLTFLGATRWQKGTAALVPDICAFGDPVCHRSGLDWHFQEKSTDPQQSLPLQ